MASYSHDQPTVPATVLYSIDATLRQVLSLVATQGHLLPAGYVNDISPSQAQDLVANSQATRAALRRMSADLGIPLHAVDVPVSRVVKALLNNALFLSRHLDPQELVAGSTSERTQKCDIAELAVQIQTAIERMDRTVE